MGVAVGVAVGSEAHTSANEAMMCASPASVAPDAVHV